MKNLLLLFIFSFLFFHPSASYAQKTKEVRGVRSLGPHQKWWLMTHLFVAPKAYKLTKIVLEETALAKADARLDGDANGGQVDAFRHSFWMAYLSQHICWKKIRKLGIAHEKDDYVNYKKNLIEDGSPGDSLASEMDKFNNQVGWTTGNANRKISREELSELMKNKILAGEMRILAKDAEGKYFDCSGKLIQMENWKGSWYKPKCLIPSNQPAKK